MDKLESVARDRYLGESRVDTTPSHGKTGRTEGREESQVQQPSGQRYKNGWVTKMVGLYREEQPGPLGWRVQVWGCITKPGGPWSR